MKVLALFAISILCASLVACNTATPDAGQQAVWVSKPYFFGHGGVDPNPVTTGQQYGALSSDAIIVEMRPQRVDMEFDDMMTSSGVPVSFHVAVPFTVTDSVKLVTKFGADRYGDGNSQWGFFVRNLDQPIRTAVRDAVKKRDMQEMAISQTAADAVGDEVTQAAITLAKQLDVPITIGKINVGKVNPPDAIKNQRIQTAEQEQRVITEGQRKLAEDSRLAAETSRARADNAYREAMNLSPDQFLKLETIKMQEVVCGNNGKGTCTFFMGGGITPVTEVRK